VNQVKFLVTGAAGFIGMHTALRLLDEGASVVGVDSLNDYYDVNLKKARLARLREHPAFEFHQLDICDRTELRSVFQRAEIATVIHLAAQAGVRYSLTNPHAYTATNIEGFLNILENCRHYKVGHLVFASSSSVYGGNTRMPFSEHHPVDHPVSLYAATKKANELMAHTYSHLFALPTTGLRFFTVYGPWGRPDMALFLFTKAILENRAIDVFNNGQMQRDFTYIDDIVEGVVRIARKTPAPLESFDRENPDPASSWAPYRIFNIGNHQPVALLDYIAALELALGKKAQMNFLPMQPGDVPATCADTADLAAATGFKPKTPVKEGIARFVDWYRNYFRP
jgi:UDP-glucuronate 4-epimerase